MAGKIAVFWSQARENRNGPNGFDNLIRTVLASGVSMLWTTLLGFRKYGPYFGLTSVSVYLTSSEVNGFPSCQFASTR